MNAMMERRLERLNTTVLVLAGIAIVLYLLDLFRLVPNALSAPIWWITFFIDAVFLIDLCAKMVMLRAAYIKSPWFLIDLLSTLPIISSTVELLGSVGPQLEATRVARGARLARVTRMARVARFARTARAARIATALQAIRGQSFSKDPSAEQDTPSFDRSLMIVIPIMLVCIMAISYLLTSQELSALQTRHAQQVEEAATEAEIQRIPEYLNAQRARALRTEKIYVTKEIGGRILEFAFSTAEAHERADRTQGFMLIIVLLTTVGVVYMSRSLTTDQTKGEEISILHQFLSPSIVEKIDSNPEVVERFYRQWLSVCFITMQGFVYATEADSENIEALALQRRRVMDIVRYQVVEAYRGVVDKFIGDTVMVWLGGPFSVPWQRLASFRERLFVDELEFVEQDIRSVARKIEEIKLEQAAEDIENHMETERLLTSQAQSVFLEEVRRELEAKRETLLAKHEEAKRDTPSLEARHQEAVKRYKMQAAKAAVLCCLDICDDLAKQTGTHVFRELSIGVASGPVSIGNFGSTQQIGFTVIGPTVDRAASLDPMAAQYGCRLLIDLETYELIKESTELQFRMLPYIAINSGAAPIATYEPFKRETVDQAFFDAFHEGVFAMQHNQLEKAIQCFKTANTLRDGGDVASLLWVEACETVLRDHRNLSRPDPQRI